MPKARRSSSVLDTSLPSSLHPALPTITSDPSTSRPPVKFSTKKWLLANTADTSSTSATASTSSANSPPRDMASAVRRSSSRLELNPAPAPVTTDTSSHSTSSRMTRRSSKGSPMLPLGAEDGYGSSHSGPPVRSTRQHPVLPEVEDGEEHPDVVENGNGNGAVGDDEGQAGQPVGSSRARKGVVKDSDDEAAGEAEADGNGEEAEAGGDIDFEMHHEDDDEEDTKGARRASSGRGKSRNTNSRRVKSSSDDEDAEHDDGHYGGAPKLIATTSLHGRPIRRPVQYAGNTTDEDDLSDRASKKKGGARRGLRRGGSSARNGASSSKRDGFVVPDDDYDRGDGGYGERKRSSRMEEKRQREQDARKELDRARRAERRESDLTKKSEPRPRQTRNSLKAEDVSYDQEPDHEDETSTDEDEEDLHLDDGEDEEDGGVAPRRNLRQKTKIDYYNIPALEAPPEKGKKGKGKQRAGDPFTGLPHNMTGAQWAALYPEKGGQDDSDDDDGPTFSTPRKAALFSSNAAAAAAGFAGSGANMFAGSASMDMAAAGTPNNLGKVTNGASLADTDPLGVSSSISFDSVGGLGAHIQQLKEMVSLPLLYPEVFERFNITPPRGVLFHGPPGTGKTLLARALAASCSTEGRKISFFMRKGADCLSKWVGEAERQLRLLFEEAKACQPSIIFFDEIDGLAPVRSSKQEQIHASIVSTLLALMDGMDGRGQVIVIGATNRPDAIDPALRRPGRFDREFYFPLPNLEGRRKILDIHTSGWNPPIEESFKDELAALTKGYGGADLRALCTEAALNAVQRTYPQIYKTNDRLVIKPETIDVTARDFIVSQKNLIPSTARATSSAAAPIPPQLVPLLSDALEAAKVALTKVLPEVKRANVLEEAEWEDDGGGFEKEKMMQAFETLRVFRPRMLICGEPGMGQGYVGAAVLHHLEGFHVQTLDLATLVADSSRTMEAACVQLFVEAKRHKPSILFIPSLITWCASVTDTVRSTIKGLLEGLDPSDPILLLAVVDGPLADVPGDVRAWFGFVKGNRVVMTSPETEKRKAFFADVLEGIQRPPNEFPDAMPRRKRVLEVLPIAPPPPPKVATLAEVQQLEQNDQRLLEYLKWRLGPVLNELKKRYKRFTRSLYDDWRSDDLAWRQEQQEKNEEIVGLGKQPYHNVDLDSMHMDLYNGVYHTPDDFLTDILRIQANAEINSILENDGEAPVKAGMMVNHSKVMLDQTFDAQFKTDCARMAERMKEREKNAPAGANGKGKGKGKAVVSEAAAAAAAAAGGGGGRYGTRSRHGLPSTTTTGPVELEDIGAIERRLKRTRKEGEDSQATSQAEGEEGHGPSKRPKAHDVDGVDGMLVDAEGEVDLTIGEENGVRDHEPVASTSRLNGASNGGASIHDLLNSTSYSPHQFDPTTTTPSLPSASTSGHASGEILQGLAITNGSQDGLLLDVVNMEFSGPLDDLPQESPLSAAPLPDPASLPLPPRPSVLGTAGTLARSGTPAVLAGSSSAVRFADNVDVAPAAELHGRETTPDQPIVRVSEDGTAALRSASPIVVDPPTPEPLPDFVLSEHQLDAISVYLGEETRGLNVDQLEQLRAACYDIIWRRRKEWDREAMLVELDAVAKEFVEEVRECSGYVL